MEKEINLKKMVKQSLINVTTLKATKTTEFILPLLGYTKKYYEPYLINAYLGDYDFNGYDANRIYIVMSNHNMDTKHARIEDSIKSLCGFIDYYDIFEGRISVFIVEIPEEHIEDYKHFLNGSYSKFSQDAQIKIVKGRSETSSMPHIFKKSETLKIYWENRIGAEIPKDAEVWPILNIDHEIFVKERLLAKKEVKSNKKTTKN
jgi:hypothetical protein